MKEYLADYKKIARLAYPVVLSSAIDMVMMMVDRLFLSRFGNQAEVMLGGAMGGALLFVLLQAPAMGMLNYTNAMASQNFGRNDLPRCAQVITQALYWALLYYPLMLALSLAIPKALAFMGHEPALAAAEWDYSRILIMGGIFSLARIPLSSFFIASNRSHLVMQASFIGLLLNVPLNYWFIFDLPLPTFGVGFFGEGSGGLRPSALGIGTGIAGAASATVAAQLVICTLLLLWFLRQKQVYRIAKSWRVNWDIHSKLLRYGLPSSLESLLTLFAFNTFLMLFYSISPLVAAAGTITFSWDLCNYIVLMGVGTATTTLVGQSLGAQNIALARRYTRLILGIALAFSGFFSLWFIFVPDLLSLPFVTQAAVDPEGLAHMSRQMLRWAGFYLIADALGSVMIGALRGAGDTLAVMHISVIAHFLMLAGVIVLFKVFQWGAMGIWVFFGLFVVCVNGAFTARYIRGAWARRWQS